MTVSSVAGTLTATQASEALGESPANCAFHLRTLAKYGFVREAGGGRGRERPWMAAHRRISVSPHQLGETQAKMAAQSLGHVMQERWLDKIRRAFAAEAWPAGWEGSVERTRSLQWLTADEARHIEEEVLRLLTQYNDRRTDPSSRPAGALPVEFMFFGYPVAGMGAPESATEE